MKAVIAALILVGSSAMAMTYMPDGVYQGQGRWNDNKGQTGNYDISATVKADVVSSIYTFNDHTKQYEFAVKPDANGQFDVLVGSHKVGSGYCMSVQCHYAIMFGTTDLEETLTFYQDHLYRIGSKRDGGKIVTWEESMTKQGE